jgi:hypothetical protein
MMMKRMSQALAQADEYRRLISRGEVVLADGCLRTIRELVGRWDGPRLVLPQVVADVMGEPQLGGGR